MNVGVNTACNIMQKPAKRCHQVLFEFWLWRSDSPLFKITGKLGACPQTKLTISAAEIGSIHRKCTYTCKSRDSRKSSKKQNLSFTDFAFYLRFIVGTRSLKNNAFPMETLITFELFKHIFLSTFSDFFGVFRSRSIHLGSGFIG